jgi:hypothetical protein
MATKQEGTIVIGLGGVGKVVLMKLRKLIVEQFAELKKDIAFLHIDTFAQASQEIGQDFPSEVLGIDITLKPTERVELSVGLPKPPRTKDLVRHPNVAKWFPPDLPINIDFAEGAGGIRAYGKLAFHYRIKEARTKIINAASSTGSSNEKAVYIVGSFFGGTASGIFLDVCYATRAALDKLKPKLTGFFIIGAEDPNADMIVNCYSALMELEYYAKMNVLDTMKNHGHQHNEQSRAFEACYPETGFQDIVTTLPPVDFCYLIDTNNGTESLGRSALEEMVAKRIFFATFPEMGGSLAGKRVDIKGKAPFVSLDSDYQKPRSFLTTGCSLVEFPAPRLKSALGKAFAAYCCQHLLYKNAPGFSDLEGAIIDFIKNNAGVELSERTLKKEFEKQDTRTVSKSMKDVRFKWLTDLRDRIKQGAIKEGTLHSDAENVVAEAMKDIGGKGMYVSIINDNMEKAWTKAEDSIDTTMNRYVSDSTVGPHRTADFIDHLLEKLGNEQKRVSNIYGGSDTILRGLRDRVSRRLNRIKEDETFPWEVGKHIEWLCNKDLAFFMEQGLRRAVYETMTTLFNRIIIKLEAIKAQINAFVTFLNDAKESSIEEARGVCSNLVAWVRGETQGDHNYLVSLNKFLSDMINLDDIGQLYKVFATLPASYNIADCFDGNIDTKARAIIGSLGSAYESFNKDSAGFREGLFHACRNVFDAVESVNICDLLVSSLKLEGRNSLFANKIGMSEWFLQFASLNDPAIMHSQTTHEIKWVSVPMNVDLNNHPIWEGTISGCKNRDQSVPTPYRMLFATELGVFCLRNITLLADYARVYRGLPLDQKRTCHTNAEIEFPDLMPPDPRIAGILDKSERAVLMGRIFGFLEEATDPETHYMSIYLHHSDPATGARLNDRLCDKWDDAVKVLNDQQVKKEIDKQYTGVTQLELLNNEIDRFAKSKRTKEEKEQLFEMIQAFLKEKLLGMEGDEKDKERHPAYQKSVRITNEFQKQFNITTPSGL